MTKATKSINKMTWRKKIEKKRCNWYDINWMKKCLSFFQMNEKKWSNFFNFMKKLIKFFQILWKNAWIFSTEWKNWLNFSITKMQINKKGRQKLVFFSSKSQKIKNICQIAKIPKLLWFFFLIVSKRYKIKSKFLINFGQSKITGYGKNGT